LPYADGDKSKKRQQGFQRHEGIEELELGWQGEIP
jgi:hypothetical protein